MPPLGHRVSRETLVGTSVRRPWSSADPKISQEKDMPPYYRRVGSCHGTYAHLLVANCLRCRQAADEDARLFLAVGDRLAEAGYRVRAPGEKTAPRNSLVVIGLACEISSARSHSRPARKLRRDQLDEERGRSFGRGRRLERHRPSRGLRRALRVMISL